MADTRRITPILNKILNVIWSMGDQEQCSIKHIGWATAMLANGYTWSDDPWSEGRDYKTPWSREIIDHSWC